MVGVPGTAERLFRSLAAANVNVVLISQASSEHTICFALRSEDVHRAKKGIHHEFRYEFQNAITVLDEKPHQTIVAIVGEGMKGTPGVAGTVFQTLGLHNISISAIAQGASERNISFVIGSGEKIRALGVIHEAFFEERKRLKLVVLGVGNIGSALLGQLHQQRAYLLEKGFDIEVCGIADSRHCLLAERGIDLSTWRTQLARAPKPPEPGALAHRLRSYQWTNVALVDCTASAEVVEAYPAFVRANMHIVTPNKKANVLPWQRYAALMELLQQRQKHFLYEANVGAGLPVISTLLDLVASGDTVLKIEGIFSGTLSYLFSTFDGSVPFSRLLEHAHAIGYTEPDPRDDLSGADVARKLLILARQLGMTMDLGDVKTENLVAGPLRKGAFRGTFFRKMAAYDGKFLERLEAARKRKHVLRYVGSLQKDRATGGLAEFPLDHPFAAVKGGDNVVAFTTRRYAHTPLIVQGPGAGADVTAMGVFSDLLKLLHYLP
jgi:aspartokinase/homoserine dehydrogenase 1